MDMRPRKMDRKGQIKADVALFLGVVSYLKSKYEVDDKAVASLIRRPVPEGAVPISIFGGKLSPLEALVKYLKENEGFRLSDIATMLGRDKSTVWNTYRNAREKLRKRLDAETSTLFLPIDRFRGTPLSIMEVVVTELREGQNMRFSVMARLLNRDQRTLWTVYDRSKNKRKV